MVTLRPTPLTELSRLHMDPEHPVPGVGDGMLLARPARRGGRRARPRRGREVGLVAPVARDPPPRRRARAAAAGRRRARPRSTRRTPSTRSGWRRRRRSPPTTDEHARHGPQDARAVGGARDAPELRGVATRPGGDVGRPTSTSASGASRRRSIRPTSSARTTPSYPRATDLPRGTEGAAARLPPSPTTEMGDRPDGRMPARPAPSEDMAARRKGSPCASRSPGTRSRSCSPPRSASSTSAAT